MSKDKEAAKMAEMEKAKAASKPAEKAIEKAGGMLGNAGKAIMGRKSRLDAMEEEAVKPAKYADGGMVKKAASGHPKIAKGHCDKPFKAK